MNKFNEIEKIIKIPGIRGVYVFDKRGKEIYRESTFPKDREYYKELIDFIIKNKENLPKIFYIFTDTHLVIIAHNEEIFLSISFKEINLGLLRIHMKKFLNID